MGAILMARNRTETSSGVFLGADDFASRREHDCGDQALTLNLRTLSISFASARSDGDCNQDFITNGGMAVVLA